MIYKIGSKILNLPETGGNRKLRTPAQVVPYRDMAETCRNLDAVCSILPYPLGSSLVVVDGVARSGFWGAIFSERWPNCSLILNEENKECVDILKLNYPTAVICYGSLSSWVPPTSDILFLDFDAFTLKKFKHHKRILEQVAPTTKWLLIADSTCFGFKFGNMKHYGVSTMEEYFTLLNKETNPSLDGKRIVAVSYFSNSAIVLYGHKKGNDIIYLPPTDLPISRGGKLYKNSRLSEEELKRSKGFEVF